MRAEYQTLQAERFGFVGARTPGVPARGAPPEPPPAAPRFEVASVGYASPAHSVPSSDGGGTSRRTSHTTASSFFARLIAGTGDGHVTPPAAYGSSEGSDRSPGPSSLSKGGPLVAGDSGPSLEDPRTGPDLWLGPDPGVGRICGCRPGVPFTPPYIRCPYCEGPGAVLDTPPSPYDPCPPPLGGGLSFGGPAGRPVGWDGDLCHSPLRISRDECRCGAFCLCASEPRQDGRLPLADPMSPPGAVTETTPDRRRPRVPTVDPPPDGRLPCIDCATYGSVFVLYVPAPRAEPPL